MYKKRIGECGERFAVGYLEAKGFEILETDYRLKFGQVDIIARDEKGIHFVEVKTRTGIKYGRPADAVDDKKLAHIKNVALYYMNKKS